MDEPTIKAKAIELCRAAGEDPFRRVQEFGRTCWAYAAWEDWRQKAIESLNGDSDV